MSTRGEFTSVTDTVTQASIDAYAELSGDFNPLHVDPVAAAASEFGGIIAHGPIALHSFFRSATDWLGTDALPPGSSVQITYRAPTRPGDAVACEVTSSEDSEDGTTTKVEAACVKQDGTTVVTVKATLPK
ncbi:MaoC family dehydratase [Conexibacter sp. CPCC 206217]|uniref:MaoC family dehydratase n=1 Tax=Conexibacter sp. CPCC 206217 TaxID=3064574 RepID=UPI00271E9F50|nr:MaoC family dehydratase [Conexibacter sp. CPCC 206217]MDO8212441.1 MaoC family dehydratase [Conexibacter sp. CPCC 206217]